jgi:hypothetical protein
MYLALIQAVEDDDDISIDRGDIGLVLLVLLIVLCVVAIVYYWQRINKGP